MRDKTIQLLKRHEGLKLQVYDDATGKPLKKGDVILGNPTIGIGRLLTSDRGLSADEAIFLCTNDVEGWCLPVLRRIFKYWEAFGDARQDALLSMMFNLGEKRFQEFRAMIVAIQSNDWQRASVECLDSLAARQNPERYIEISNMLKKG